MITKQRKAEQVQSLVEKFKKVNSYYFIDFTGMNVETTLQFRRELKKKQMELKVAKNTLLERALSEAGNLPGLKDGFRGPTGVIFGYGDPIEPARILKERIEKFQQPIFKGAVVEGIAYGADQLKTLAALPSKSDIIASILGSLDAPISGIIGSINAVIRDLAYLIEEVAKKNSQ
ncbi:MAG: 50S ribosomal protein L10 [Ignavibacteria bacterium]|nr:50S ribosomal protein L10 [Ignavibacteria bacterium]